jgi:hypothetical protein
MTIEKIEHEVIALQKDSQTARLSRLLKHLGQSREIDPEIASIWSAEKMIVSK